MLTRLASPLGARQSRRLHHPCPLLGIAMARSGPSPRYCQSKTARELGDLRGRTPLRLQNRRLYINCALVCLCVTTTPWPLVTLDSGARVSATFSSLLVVKR